MRQKILNALLIVTSLFGYLEWGGNNSSFLFKAEADVIAKLFSNPESAAHPFTLLPLAGQVLLLITLFQSKPNKGLTYSGIAGIGILLLMMFAIGLISLNFKILLSTLPFIITAILAIRNFRSQSAIIK